MNVYESNQKKEYRIFEFKHFFDFLLYARIFSVTTIFNKNENCSWSSKRTCFPTRSRKARNLPRFQSFEYFARLRKFKIDFFFFFSFQIFSFYTNFHNLKSFHSYFQDYTAKLSDFGLAKDGPEGDDTHVSTRVMGTHGYAAPEYIMTGNISN